MSEGSIRMPVQPKEGKATMDPRQSSITDAFAAVPGLAEECLLAEEPLLPHPQMECGREAAPMRPATSYILFCPRCPSDDPMSTRAKVSALPNSLVYPPPQVVILSSLNGGLTRHRSSHSCCPGPQAVEGTPGVPSTVDRRVCTPVFSVRGRVQEADCVAWTGPLE